MFVEVFENEHHLIYFHAWHKHGAEPVTQNAVGHGNAAIVRHRVNDRLSAVQGFLFLRMFVEPEVRPLPLPALLEFNAHFGVVLLEGRISLWA